MSVFELELISAISNPKGKNRPLSIRTRTFFQSILIILYNYWVIWGATLGQVFVEIVEDKGRKVKNGPQKWHVDVGWHL